MITKYDVGDEVFIKVRIREIYINEDCEFNYRVATIWDSMSIMENEVADKDFVTVETYESEINELKSIIEEKDKEIARLKAPSVEIKRKDFSHHPQENIYAKSLKNYDKEKEYDKEDWRVP